MTRHREALDQEGPREGEEFKDPFPCPTCGAEPDSRCFMQPSGKTYGNVVHVARGNLWRAHRKAQAQESKVKS